MLILVVEEREHKKKRLPGVPLQLTNYINVNLYAKPSQDLTAKQKHYDVTVEHQNKLNNTQKTRLGGFFLEKSFAFKILVKNIPEHLRWSVLIEF